MSLGYYSLMGSKKSLIPEDLRDLGINWRFIGDANATNGVVLNSSGTLDTFKDLSDNNAHFDATATLDANKPSIGAGGEIEVVGSSSKLISSKASSYWDFLGANNTNDIVLFARIKDNNVGSTSGIQHYWSAGGNISSDNQSWYQQRLSNNRFRAICYETTANFSQYESSTGVNNESGFWNLGTFLDSSVYSSVAVGASAAAFFLYKNNVQAANLSGTRRDDYTINTGETFIIGGQENSLYTSDIEILKMCIGIGSLDTSKRNTIETWLNT